MKKMFLCFIATLLILISGISLVGCDMETGTPAIPDYNADIQVVVPEDIDAEHFAVEEDTTYYTSLWKKIRLITLRPDFLCGWK